MRYHFIAIGGSVMHNLAIALYLKGDVVTGSDDEIFEPSKSRLSSYGLLPESAGWFPDKIVPELDAVILGMHARGDNSELIRAKQLGIRIFSMPEFLYEHAKNKKRIVIGGSHGKTTITAMILHVLDYYQMPCDYLVGAQLEGFEVMVKLSDDSPVMIFEGDEYLTSALDPRPKFHVYRPDVGLLSGIAWDHMNVFPTFENYIDQFRKFIDLIPAGGMLIYYEGDGIIKELSDAAKISIAKIPYGLPEFVVRDGVTFIIHDGKEISLKVFGKHNLLNLNGARLICQTLGIGDEQFYRAIVTFKGASKRLEKLAENNNTAVFKDFAHAPSKVNATTQAMKEQYPGRKLVACLELHTYSSLNQMFLKHYGGAMDAVDIPFVYYNQHTIALKRLPELTVEQVFEAFGHPLLKVFCDSSLLREALKEIQWKDKNLLMMSSGNFDGLDLSQLATFVTKGNK